MTKQIFIKAIALEQNRLNREIDSLIVKGKDYSAKSKRHADITQTIKRETGGFTIRAVK